MRSAEVVLNTRSFTTNKDLTLLLHVRCQTTSMTWNVVESDSQGLAVALDSQESESDCRSWLSLSTAKKAQQLNTCKDTSNLNNCYTL